MDAHSFRLIDFVVKDLKDVIKARTLSKKESKIEGAAAAKPALPAAEKQSNGKGFSHSVDVEPLSIMMEADTDTSILLYAHIIHTPRTFLTLH